MSGSAAWRNASIHISSVVQAAGEIHRDPASPVDHGPGSIERRAGVEQRRLPHAGEDRVVAISESEPLGGYIAIALAQPQHRLHEFAAVGGQEVVGRAWF